MPTALLDVHPGALGSILWADELGADHKVARLSHLTRDNLALLISESLAEQGRGRWDDVPSSIFYPAIGRILHDGDTPDEAYRWAQARMSESGRRPSPPPDTIKVGPCLVWNDPPPAGRYSWIPTSATLARLREHPGRWALVHVLSKRAGIEAASKIRTGKVEFWLKPDEWEAVGGTLEDRAHTGLWLRFERRRAEVPVDDDRRQAAAVLDRVS